MDVYRFYCVGLAGGRDGGLVTLPEDQAHHALHVLRLEVGTEVELFDGAGAGGRGKLVEVSKKKVVVELAEDVRVNSQEVGDLILATAVPKADRAEWLVEQASQLNVRAIQWMDCQRSVVKPREGGGKMEKWRRLAIESAKQCGRNKVLELREMLSLEQVLGEYLNPGKNGVAEVWMLDPRAEKSALERIGEYRHRMKSGQGARGILALVGPEGGWSEAELALLDQTAQQNANVVRLRLTPTVLRIETATAAIAALCGTE